MVSEPSIRGSSNAEMVWGRIGGGSWDRRADSSSGGVGGRATRHLLGEMPSHQKVATGGILRITVSHVLYPVTKEVLHQVLEAYGVEQMSMFERVNQVEAMVQLQSWQGAERARDALHGRCIYNRCCFLDVQLVQPTTEPTSTKMARRDAEASMCAPEVVVEATCSSPPDKPSASTDEPKSESLSLPTLGCEWDDMSDEQKRRCLKMVIEVKETLYNRLGWPLSSRASSDATAPEDSTDTTASLDGVDAVPLSQGKEQPLDVLEVLEVVPMKTHGSSDDDQPPRVTALTSTSVTGKDHDVAEPILVADATLVNGRLVVVDQLVVLWPHPVKCVGWSPWSPHSQVTSMSHGAEAQAMPWPSFRWDRCDEQLKQPWPPPLFLLNEVVALDCQNAQVGLIAHPLNASSSGVGVPLSFPPPDQNPSQISGAKNRTIQCCRTREMIIDGIDICTLGLHDLRSRFDIIPQEPVLFEGTIRSNIDPIGQYSDAEIWQALERCQPKDVVASKPEKLDALVADSGENGSVGQRQLLCLGRVIVKQAQILFMDKATASVDSQTDISKGAERVRISVVNEIGSEKCPPSFYYIPRNLVFQNAYVNISVARIGDEDCCADCYGNCLSAPIPCACARETGGEYAYTLEGRLDALHEELPGIYIWLDRKTTSKDTMVGQLEQDGVVFLSTLRIGYSIIAGEANLVKQVTEVTNKAAGEVTTCATVLTQAILTEGCMAVAAGVNVMDLRKGINKAINTITAHLKSKSWMVNSSEEINQVATISANGEQEIGDLISKAREKVGKDGVITIVDGNTLDNELEAVQGMKLSSGYISPYLVTDQKTQKCEMENPLILIHDKKISNMNSLLPVLEISIKNRKPLVIVAEDVEGEALSTLALNKHRARLKDNDRAIVGIEDQQFLWDPGGSEFINNFYGVIRVEQLLLLYWDYGEFQIDGTLLAPPDMGYLPKHTRPLQWIIFKWLHGFTRQGAGTVDGQSSSLGTGPMGRGKVELKKIENPTNHKVTFSKRRAGLLKKANEIFILCDAQIGVIIFSGSGKMYECSSPPWRIANIFDRYLKAPSTRFEEIDIQQKIIHEMTRMKDENNRLRIIMRKYMGEDLASLTLQDVINLEQKIEFSLYKVRLRKQQLLDQQLLEMRHRDMRISGNQSSHLCCMFPGIVFTILSILYAIIWGEKSSGAVLFGTMFALVLLWFGNSAPLVFVGSYLGYKKEAIEDLVKTNKIPI